MTRIHPAHRRRSAFTLVEMLVAAALIIFMMWIISTAFQKGLEAFSTLKTAGDMQEKLRGATTVIRRDLTRPHFSADGAFHGEDLSDQRLDDNAWGNDPTKGTPGPPLQGYFRIFQSGNRVADGLDPDDPSAVHYRVADATQQGDVLQFTIKQRGARRDQTFTVDLKDGGQDINPSETPETATWGRLHRFSYPTNTRHVKSGFAYPAVVGMGPGYGPGYPLTDPDTLRTQFTTTWAEVTYFLLPNGETTGTQQRFNLYRRQNLLVTDFGENGGFGETVHFVLGPDRPLDISPSYPPYREISSWPQGAGPARVNSQKMVTAPIRRFGVDPTNAAGAFQTQIPRLDEASDLVLTDVIDFEVKVLWEPNPAVTPPIPWPQPAESPGINNPDFPFDRLPTSTVNTAAGQRVFDTWSQRNTAGQPDDYVGSGPTPLWNGGYGAGAPGPRSIPLKIRVRGVQIELRVWDQKSQTTRQITIIQDL